MRPNAAPLRTSASACAVHATNGQIGDLLSDNDDIHQSRRLEMVTYVQEPLKLYASSVAENGPLYDVAASATANFTNITAAIIKHDTRILKILRYCVCPSISQMKFGQLFGFRSTGPFERCRHGPDSAAIRSITPKAEAIADFIRTNLDASRFNWVSDGSRPSSVALEYAKNWTCSISADQNAQTAYRGWRKNLQEKAISEYLQSKGYLKTTFRGIVNARTDILPGQYFTEKKVRGRTIQKADLVVRAKNGGLVLIEAKAVGVELDAVKRAKECCDKANDWRSASSLKPQVVAVIAGFFSEVVLSNLRLSGVAVVWEHRLSDMDAYL